MDVFIWVVIMLCIQGNEDEKKHKKTSRIDWLLNSLLNKNTYLERKHKKTSLADWLNKSPATCYLHYGKHRYCRRKSA